MLRKKNYSVVASSPLVIVAQYLVMANQSSINIVTITTNTHNSFQKRTLTNSDYALWLAKRHFKAQTYYKN